MKIFAIVTTALLTIVIYATPAIVEACDLLIIPVTFIGAAGGSFTQYFPTDDSEQIICNYHSFCSSLPPAPSYKKFFLT